MRKVFWLLLLALTMPLPALPVRAQSQIELENVGTSVEFGEQVTFLATVRSSIPIQDLEIVILDETQGTTHIERLDLQADGRTEYRYDTQRNSLRPFSRVSWNYRFTLPDGAILNSEVFSFRYSDDRFDWEVLESGMLRVHWYSDDADFVQAVQESLEAALESVHRLLPEDVDEPVEFYIYENLEDLRGTLAPGSQDWIVGHADPSLGVVMVAIEPGSERELRMQQRIPHELMHVMLYRTVGTGYPNIPAWLREGMAVLAETVPNPEHERVFREATSRQDWIPIRDLCGFFPSDADRAFLAYAESGSFTGYLHKTYGPEGLLNLARAYADGADCERGPEIALGVSLAKLEQDWQASVVGQKDYIPALQNMVPYLVLLCLVLIVPVISILGSLRRKGIRHGPETYIRK